MIENAFFLLHHTRPIDFGTPPRLILVSPSGTEIKSVSLQTLSDIQHPIVTHSFSLLGDWFRTKHLKLPTQLLDLEIAKKLLVGRPKADYDAVLPWDMPSLLSSFLPARYDLVKFRMAFATHLVLPTSTNFGDMRAMVEIAAKLPYLWSSIVSELEMRGELKRYLEVETPIYNLLLTMQYHGIGIDEEERNTFLDSIEEEYVSAHHKLTIGLNVDVERAVADISYLSSLVGQPIEADSDPQKYIRAKRDENDICALLYSVDKARRNRRIVLRTGGGDHCFPIYDAIGTVTGRITAVDPRLQQLNRKYRKIIKAAPHRQLFYLDYSQFEPNIMASISNDKSLLDLCAQNDLYAQLAFELWGKFEHRSVAKTMFLEYSYGKDEHRLAATFSGIFGSQLEAETAIQKRFVPLFSGVHRWKVSVADSLLREGRIGTALGAYRYRKETGKLNSKECRWAISQVVQGTGALILKKVMLAISNSTPDVTILLPMFDALLLEVPEESATKTTSALIECFEDTFREVCPNAYASVRSKPFAS